jgi:hypothetical protein
MKHLGTCDNCNVQVITRTEYKSPNGERKCGICGKGNILLAILLLMSVVSADTFTFQGQGVNSNTNITTTETWQIGYGAQQISGGEDMVGEILILAGVALIYIGFKGGDNRGSN